MSVLARCLLVAGVVFGVAGTGIYVTDTWITGDGAIKPPGGASGVCLGIGLILVGIGLRLVMRAERR
jgi:hypothetical protein